MYTGILLERSIWDIISNILTMCPELIIFIFPGIPIFIILVVIVFKLMKLSADDPTRRIFW